MSQDFQPLKLTQATTDLQLELGRLLLQSSGFDAPKAAGQAIGQLQQALPGAWQDHAAHLQLAEGVSAADVSAALQALTEAAAA